ncbi:predicted protein [Histoplasma capsulatum G186AR]|uniref:Uncharacterized protein n=1 Tax=Ajellomyces capsulatus (strain G186AR / H82 / ATCC MYA-2454 / RMSCC 2432) TaxID=447093 RepID=C0NA59_AJECG|nr:uncharacterized protein HCBG_00005 [Histoplasma capsulatum G186AR]EEH10550.1 predicted protein [Histoplasma capsulatum G186AR]
MQKRERKSLHKVAEIILEGIQKPFHAGRQCGIWPIQPTNQHRPLDPSVANVAGAFDLLSLRTVRDTLRFSSRTSPASQQSNGMLWSGAPVLTACLSPGISAYSKLVAVGFRCWDQIARLTMTQSLSKFERREGGGAIARLFSDVFILSPVFDPTSFFEILLAPQ